MLSRSAKEHLMSEDVAVGRPTISALVVAKAGNGLPALGFSSVRRALAFLASIQTDRMRRFFINPSSTRLFRSGACRRPQNGGDLN